MLSRAGAKVSRRLIVGEMEMVWVVFFSGPVGCYTYVEGRDAREFLAYA